MGARLAAEADVSAIILAGGRSSRMGEDKASIVLHGTTLLQRVVSAAAGAASQIVLVRAPGQALPAVTAPCPVVTVADAVAGEGPLFGMATGLAAATGERCLVLGVDMPFLQPALLRLLAGRLRDVRAESGGRWVVPIAERRPQPLCSAIARDALPVLRAHLDAGDRAPMSVAADLGLARLDEAAWRAADPSGQSFMDVDTPGALDAARQHQPERPAHGV
ncbi:MAG: molybdenum cofactor guanylyltransferase [Dehalococcoidia bacterium]|nr:MAG: molybdenum cofactor guanylyltransferase [Dehalococcoidia bacterium]